MRVEGWAHYRASDHAVVAATQPNLILMDHMPEPAEPTAIPKFDVKSS